MPNKRSIALTILREYGVATFLRVVLDRLNWGIDVVLAPVYVRGYHRVSYYNNIWDTSTWLGVRTKELPQDMWVMQELIYQLEPDVLIETGTFEGGSALFFASVMESLGKGKVITIDKQDRGYRAHPRIVRMIGDSTSQEIVRGVEDVVGASDRCLVFLDSDHRKKHVLAELEAFAKFVGSGYYMVVADTNLSGHPVNPEIGEGPMEAAKEFLRVHKDFEVDRSREKFLVTYFPRGFLRRK